MLLPFQNKATCPREQVIPPEVKGVCLVFDWGVPVIPLQQVGPFQKKQLIFCCHIFKEKRLHAQMLNILCIYLHLPPKLPSFEGE